MRERASAVGDRAAAVRAVLARFGALLLPRSPDTRAAAGSTTVGAFTLRPSQVEARAAVLRAVDEFGGALIADPPGTGKTVLALAVVAARSGRAVVVAPAALRAQWLASAARAGVAITFRSFEALSRAAPARAATRTAAPAGDRHDGPAFVIVDEAHHARHRATRRWPRLAALCAGARVLLLSATPVVNRASERDALLSLFLGSRSALRGSAAARCIVRVTAGDAARPRIVRHAARGAAVDVPGLAAALRALPPPVPTADGASGASLIAMSLAMAWRSSLAALDTQLRRREQRGVAMRALLDSGAALTPRALQAFTFRDDAVQLAFGALLVERGARRDAERDAGGDMDGDADRAAERLARLGASLDAHVAGVRRIRAHMRPFLAADGAARADAVRAVCRDFPARRVVVFARHAATVRALWSALRHEPGVVAIIGDRVLAAAGRWSRDEVLRSLGAGAPPLRTEDPRHVRLLLATDVLAEGIELPAMGVVVHADGAWTPARMRQREGRVTRATVVRGEATPRDPWPREVAVCALAAPRAAEEIVRLGARLRRKRRDAAAAMRDVRAVRAIARLIRSCAPGRARDDAPGATPDPVPGGPSDGACLHASGRGRVRAFVAAVRHAGGWRWVSGRECAAPAARRWRIGHGPVPAWRVLRRLDPRRCVCAAAGAAALRDVRAVLARAAERTAAADVAGVRHADDTPSRAHAARIARVRVRLDRLRARAPAITRPVLADRHHALLDRLARPMSAGRERQLDALLAMDGDDARFARRLGALIRDWTGSGSAPGGSATTRHDPATGPAHGSVGALLVLLPPPATAPRRAGSRSAPTATSPGSAGPR